MSVEVAIKVAGESNPFESDDDSSDDDDEPLTTEEDENPVIDNDSDEEEFSFEYDDDDSDEEDEDSDDQLPRFQRSSPSLGRPSSPLVV